MAVPLPPPPTGSSNIHDSFTSSSTDVKSTNPLLIPPSSTSSASSTPQANTNTDLNPKPTLHSLLNQLLTITLKDNRTIIGHLLCVDHSQNIILRDAEEFKPFYPLTLKSDEMTQEEKEKWDEVRRNREEYWPRSVPLPVHQTDRGWGGRGVGMVCIRGKDVGKIEVGKETWKGLGGEVDN